MTKLTGLQITDLIKASGLFYGIEKRGEAPVRWRCGLVRWDGGQSWVAERPTPWQALADAAKGAGLLNEDYQIAICPPGYAVPGESDSGDTAAATKAERDRCLAACRVYRQKLMASANYVGATTCSEIIAMIESGRAI